SVNSSLSGYKLANLNDGAWVEARFLGTGVYSACGGGIESRIDGTFEGWTGQTIVKLQNGQIWQQASYSYRYHYAYGPRALLYKAGSSYKMLVENVRG